MSEIVGWFKEYWMLVLAFVLIMFMVTMGWVLSQ